MDGFPDETGKPLPADRMRLIGQASEALMKLTDWERGFVLCWFCRGCHRYVGPGDCCRCEDDE